MAYKETELRVEHEDTSSRAPTPDLTVTPSPNHEKGAQVRLEMVARVLGATPLVSTEHA